MIADNIITVNAAISQSAQPAVNAGIEVDRGAQPNSSFLWIETSGKWAANNGNGSIFIAADSAESYANGAFASANLNNGVNLTQNTNITNAGTYANSAFLAANTPSHVANSAASYANSAFITANTPSNVANSAASYANSGFTTANSAASYANSAFATANNSAGVNLTQNTSITSAFAAANSAAIYANSAFAQANSGGVTIGDVLALSIALG